jgi:hypothetical protein
MIDRRGLLIGAAAAALFPGDAGAAAPDYTKPILIWPGALSRAVRRYRNGLHEIAARIGPRVSVLPSDSGTDGWEEVAEYCIQRKVGGRVLIGHSNGVLACTKLAGALKPHGIKVAICAIDKTLLWCPPLGSNVVACAEIYAGLSRVRFGDDFKGAYFKWDFEADSHVGVTYNPHAQRLAANFAKNWGRNLGII